MSIAIEHDALRAAIQRAIPAIVPPPRLKMSEWAEKYRVLPDGAGPVSGPWRNRQTPYAIEPMDVISGGDHKDVVLQWGSQLGKTEILFNTIGFFSHYDPSPILLVEPTISLAESYSKTRISKTITSSPALLKTFGDSTSRASGNTILLKQFSGGFLQMAGSNSATELSGRPIRVLLMDEVGRFEESAGTEGDPVELAMKRTSNFFDKVRVLVSSPAVEDRCRINKAFLRSDQRYYFVPCPHCGEKQVLKWEHVKFDPKDTSTAYYAAPCCGGVVQDKHKRPMLNQGEWIATNPDAPEGVAGFHLSSLYSPWVTFSELAEEFLTAQDDRNLLQVFVNTRLSEVWKLRQSSEITPGVLAQLREDFGPADLDESIVMVISASDVQGYGIETYVYGVNAKHQIFIIEHKVFNGHPEVDDDQCWRAYTQFRETALYPTKDGRKLKPVGHAIDAGYATQQVLKYCAPLNFQNVFAIRGQEGNHPYWPIKQSNSKKFTGLYYYKLGIDGIKDELDYRMTIDTDMEKQRESNRAVRYARNISDATLEQLCNEVIETKKLPGGRFGRKYVPRSSSSRLEARDCTVYAVALIEGLSRLRNLDPRHMPKVWPEQKPKAPEKQGGMFDQKLNLF